MRYHRGPKPTGRGYCFILPPLTTLDITRRFNIDPWTYISTPRGAFHSMEPLPKPCKDTPTKNILRPMNDSPGLFLFGLVFPILDQRFRFFIYSHFLCHKIFLLHSQNTYLKSEEFCLFKSYEDGKISVVEAWCLAHRDFYGRHLLFFLPRRNTWKMELSDSCFCLFLPAKTGPPLEPGYTRG
jgi:hypothetical protein